MIERTLNAFIIGPSGDGKSWLGSTTPPPRLIIDMEGRVKYTPNGRGATWWDGVSDPMALKATPSPTRTYAVKAMSTDILDSVRQWLRSGKHPFKSFTADSLMEAQVRVIGEVRPGTVGLRTQDWGSVLREMEQLVRDVRDMTMIPETGLKVAVFIAGSRREADVMDAQGKLVRVGKIRPLMQGQINTRLPYIMDVVGYLENTFEAGQPVRKLWIGQRPENDLEVKDGTNDLKAAFGPFVPITVADQQINDFTTMFDALLPETVAATS